MREQSEKSPICLTVRPNCSRPGGDRRTWRRAVIIIAAVFIGCVPAAAEVQAPRLYRIGVLNEAWAANHPTAEGLKEGLRELGLIEGQDVTFDIRFTRGDPEATRAAAKALVQSGVDLIFTSNETAAQAAKAATRTLPVVFTLVGDPVTAGIVGELARPGGNVTGISGMTTELVAKRLQMLKTLAPKVHRVWAIHYGADPSSVAAVAKAEAAAAKLGLVLESRSVLTTQDLERAVRDVRPGEALLAPDVAMLDIPGVLLEVSLSSRVPVVFSTSVYVGYGGLVSYGPDFRAVGIQAARLVARIVRGAQPKDLPVEGADRLDLAVNLKTAAHLGLTVPRKILLRADMLRR